MANQPKKYKKFVATAATATLVASAIVPVASAATPSDIAGNDHEAAIKALLELGYVSGKADGSFAPNETVTRGQVALMLGKWAKALGLEAPADYATKEYFNDYPTFATEENKEMFALVKANGIFQGYTDGSLKPQDKISRQQMAVVLDSAYKAITGKSLKELAGDTSNVTVADIEKVNADYRDEVKALKALKITAVDNFNPTGNVTRGQFASFLNATINAKAPTSEAGVIKSLTATSTNQLTVVFDGAVNPETAKFSVARGTTGFNVTEIDWNEDKTEAVLTVDTKFTDATYTLTVSGVASEDLKASVTTTRETVTAIEFNSEYLAFTGKEDANKNKEAKIGFTITNQYGEDITEDTNHQNFKDVKIKGIDETDIYVDDLKGGREGVVTVWVDADEDDDATGTIELSYEDGDLEIDAEQDVTLSDESEPGSVEILKVYNENEEEFTTENVKDKHDFYILFNVTDQYGVKLDAEDYEEDSELDGNLQPTSPDAIQIGFIRDNLRIDVSNDDIFEIDDEDQITVKEIDGKHYFAVPLTFDLDDVIGGENTVTFRSKATGEENSAKFNLVSSSEVQKVELGTPDEVVAADETVKLPVFAYDQAGELITDAADLNDKLRSKDGKDPELKITWDTPRVKNSGSQTSAFNFVEEDGQVYLEFETTSHDKDKAEDLEIEIEVDDSGEESSVELSVYAKAYAESIVNVDVDTYVYKDGELDVKFKAIKVEDQYGRAFDDVENYTIQAVSKDPSKIAINGKDTFAAAGDKIKLVGNNDGSATVEFKLVSNYTDKGTAKTATDTQSVTFRTVDEDDFKSYVVKSDGKLYGEVATKDFANIEVYGVTSNGVEVELPKSAYSISAVSGAKYLDLDVTSGDVATTQTAVDKLKESGVTSIDTEVAVIINKDGQRVTHALTIGEDDPAVAALNVKDKESASEKSVKSFDVNIASGATSISTTNLLDALANNNAIAEGKWDLEDQYGEDVTVSGTTVTFFDGSTDQLKLRISDVNAANDEDYKVTSNGTSSASINVGSANGVQEGDSFTLTISVDGVEQSYKVYVK
ncbi:hypothetical protein JOD29_002325 [Lysinibacillus composti]|uniref:S-layer homology domain-containing protein n=1 Tax=Lysinibacillus composti TaxID=720633 RepID=A0A3N9UHF5_9BACI|nr:S-layer homology domain-containing protein [Lysinibacillus composti]MBM7609059.1 hypothetical protein [Lysinibacillus composti]RQW75520.1 S-layer homology domain-containing protein [Lysinibacillus composti]